MTVLFPPRSLEIDDEETSEEEEEDECGGVPGPPAVLEDSPFSILRKGGSIVIEGQGPAGSAFTSYVRKRGEPDGRQAGTNDSPTSSNSQVHYSRARSFID